MSNKMDEDDGSSILPNDGSVDRIVSISNLGDDGITSLLFHEDLLSNYSSVPTILNLVWMNIVTVALISVVLIWLTQFDQQHDVNFGTLNYITLPYSQGIQNVKRFDMITTDDWVKKCENVKNFEEHFIGSQSQVEDAVESFIINLGVDSEDEDSFSEQ